MDRPVERTFAWFQAAAMALLVGACTEPEVQGPALGSREASPRVVSSPEDAGIAADLAFADGAAPEIDVGGMVRNSEDAPVVGRPLVIVDARGHRFDELTDEGGGFWAMGVVPPYDIAFAPAPSGPAQIPVAALGIARADPMFVLDEWTEAPGTATLRARILLPKELEGSAHAWISAVSRSPSGHGAIVREVSVLGHPPRVEFAIEHDFVDGAPPSDEPIAWEAVLGDSIGRLAHVAGASPAADPDTVVELSEIAASMVPLAGPSGLVVADPDHAAWAWSLALVSAGEVLPMPWTRSSAPLRWPSIAGREVRLVAETSDPGDGLRRAWSDVEGALPPSVALAPLSELRLVDPASPRGGAGEHADLVWEASAGGMFELTLRGPGDEALFRVLTADPSLAFARLEPLDLAVDQAGTYRVDLVQRSAALEAWLASDPSERDALRRRAGSYAELHESVVLSPATWIASGAALAPARRRDRRLLLERNLRDISAYRSAS